MTFTAQALFSFSFLACVPLQQDSILVAEEIKNRHYLIFFIANKTVSIILDVVTFTSFFLFSVFSLCPVAFVFCLDACCCKSRAKNINQLDCETG